LGPRTRDELTYPPSEGGKERRKVGYGRGRRTDKRDCRVVKQSHQGRDWGQQANGLLQSSSKWRRD